MAHQSVSLVIPGRNCAATIAHCLSAVIPLLRTTSLEEVIFVDDGSTDDTAAIVEKYDVEYVRGSGKGPGAARNIGWKRARHPLVWFVDADCVAEPEALELLLPHLEDSNVAAVGGSYGTMTADSLLAGLIHEEIVERHLAMSARVDFLASFNVLFRRTVLERTGGFNESFLKAQDAELAWRVLDAGYQLAFDVNSLVKHFHPVRWRNYFATQRQQGYWRVWLYSLHRRRIHGDSYSGTLDHLQPPLAMLSVATAPLAVAPRMAWVPACAASLLVIAQLPMALRLVRRKRHLRYVALVVMGFLRAFARGAGMLSGLIAVAVHRLSRSRRDDRMGAT